MEDASASVSIVVADADLATAYGSGDVDVLATPRVVALVEEAAVAAAQALLEPGTTSVGTRIDLRHLAPSEVGAEITATARLTAHQGRKLTFSVEARMGEALIAIGKHDRAIVARADFPG